MADFWAKTAYKADKIPVAGEHRRAYLERLMLSLKPLHPAFAGSSWQDEYEEAGEDFHAYIANKPRVATRQRHTLYIQPLGRMSKTQRLLASLTQEFLSLYFGLPSRMLPMVGLSSLPRKAHRLGEAEQKQFDSTVILDEILLPKLPKDAFATIGLTAADLWADDLNFVYGEAYTHDRVGIWSLARLGQPEESQEAFQETLLRCLKTASHETGHMLSMEHCTAYECNMCGANDEHEGDRFPLALCPECLPKLCWSTGSEPLVRFCRLLLFCQRNKLLPEADLYARSLSSLALS